MKKGAGSDPFGSGDDDAVDGQDGGTGDDVDDSSSRDDRSEDLDEGLESEPFTDDAAVEQAIETADDNELDLPQPGRDDSGVPWVYTRSNVKDSRDMSVIVVIPASISRGFDDSRRCAGVSGSSVQSVSDIVGTSHLSRRETTPRDSAADLTVILEQRESLAARVPGSLVVRVLSWIVRIRTVSR